jgi:hypothetical protein
MYGELYDKEEKMDSGCISGRFRCIFDKVSIFPIDLEDIKSKKSPTAEAAGGMFPECFRERRRNQAGMKTE